MAYCLQADIEKLIPALELAELTAESGSTVDAAVVTEAITKADAEIDSYCQKFYTVPFTAVPAVVEALSVDLAIYHLYSRRSVVPDIRKYRYESAIKFLAAVAAGELLVAGATALTAPAEAIDVDNLTKAIQRLKDSGYDVSAADVSSLLGITVTDATTGTATTTITLEQAAQAVQRLKQAGYVLSAAEVSALLGLTITDAITPQAAPDLKALSETLLNLRQMGIVVSARDLEILFGITVAEDLSVLNTPQFEYSERVFRRGLMSDF